MTLRVRATAPALLVLAATFAWADDHDPKVRFDAPAFIEGRQVSLTQFESLHPQEKIVEFSWEISADFGLSGNRDLTAIILRLHTSEPDVTIVEYCPRSVLDSPIEGPIEIEREKETSSNLGFQANTASAMSWGANASAGVSGKNAQSVRFQQKPPQSLLVSSSLIDRGTGLLVKFRKTEQNPLEGAHPIRLTLRMPAGWRTGFLRLELEAISQKESRWSSSSVQSLGKNTFLIPILMEGDEDARQQLRQIRQSENALRAAVSSRLKRQKPETLWDEISIWPKSASSSAIDSKWLEQIFSTIPRSVESEASRLPRELAIPLKDYSRARNAFRSIGRESTVTSAR
jgi:hypothetical protein